ncbi:MAG: IS200/IS605 family transposase [Pseudomonadales bacterium]
MSRFNKLTHVLWHCQYHIVRVPKYRHRILKGPVAEEVHNCVHIYSSRLGCEAVELNVQVDHVHLLAKVPISKLIGTLKGKGGLRVFSKFPYLRERPYWGNHFWAKGYRVDTVGLDAEKVRKYVKYQERQEQNQQSLKFK